VAVKGLRVQCSVNWMNRCRVGVVVVGGCGWWMMVNTSRVLS
jgi:hypothetical protein